MSNRAIHWALSQKSVKTTPKFVLFVLADLADEEHSCFPSQAYLADAINATQRTAREAVKALEDAGLIRREPRWVMSLGMASRTTDRYFLAVDGPVKTGG
jgi:DNA-binding MarR family transcriptional regulator